MTRIRNRVSRIAPAVLLTSAFGAWTASGPASAQEVPARGAVEVVLAPGGHVALADGTKLTFTGVTADSRCPTDVSCIWEGEVVLDFRLQTLEGGPVPFQVVYRGRPEKRTIEGITVIVSDVEPQPESATPIEPDDYRVTVSIGAVIITEADFGRTVHMRAGQTVVVDPRDDYVDYIWTARSADPTVLEPLPQILIFPPPPPAFVAVRPGMTTLHIVREDPCRFSDPPCLQAEQRFQVQVMVH
ncbi:MAG TPA: hypothetical protein VIL43_08215 [Burkholderiales bacterium]